MSLDWRAAIKAKMNISPDDKRERNADVLVKLVRAQLKSVEKEIGSALVQEMQKVGQTIVRAMQEAEQKARESGDDNFLAYGGYAVRPLLDKIYEILDANEAKVKDEFQEYMEGKK